MGPETVAPVRVAVSTISFAAASIAEWSYAFRRMRILFCVSAAIGGGFLACCPDVRRAGPMCWGPPPKVRINAASLLDDLRHDAGADGTAALADGEAQALVHGDRLDQLDRHLDVVARHDHLRALGQVGDAGHVGRTEVELRPVAVE